MDWIKEPFFQVGLPVIITFVVSTWYQGKRVDDLRNDMNRRFEELRTDMNRRFEEVNRQFGEILKRLDHIDANQASHSDRIARLEERSSPIRPR